MPLPTTPGTSCPQTWSLTFHPHHQPHNNNDDREMRTNCNAPLKKKKNPVTNAGVDKAASCWSGLLPHSAVWCWVGGKHGWWGRVKLGGERRKGRSCFPHQLFQGWNSTSDPRSRSISGSYRTSSTVSEEPGGHSSMAPGLSAGVSS